MWKDFKEWYNDLGRKEKVGFWLVLPAIFFLIGIVMWLIGAIFYVCWLGGFWTMAFLVIMVMCGVGLFFLLGD